MNDDNPNFRDCTAFIQREASYACEPVYGIFPAKQHDDEKGVNFHMVAFTPDHVSTSGPRYRLTRTADVGDRVCMVCSQPHRLSQCELFTCMQPIERLQFAR